MKTTQKIYVNPEIKTAMIKAVQLNLPTLLVGDTGTGKTSLVREAAIYENKTLIRINLTGQTGVDEFIGKFLASEKGTYWVDGPLIVAMKKGYWVVLDEINMALPEILSKLHSLLDDDRQIMLNEKDGEIVKPHESFRLFATMNPSDEYAGTKELNKAFLSRFPIVLDIGYSDKEENILVERTGISESTAKILVKLAEEIRYNKLKENTTYPCSTRDLLYCAMLIQAGLPQSTAIEMSMINKSPKDEHQSLIKLTELITGEVKISEEIAYNSITELIEQSKIRNKEFESMKRLAAQTKQEYDEYRKSTETALAVHNAVIDEYTQKLTKERDETRKTKDSLKSLLTFIKKEGLDLDADKI